MQPKFKPSVPGEKHKGYYGNKPIKKDEGTGGVIATRRGMQEALPSPCVECPLRRDSAPGYLGGYTPEMYIEVLHSPASLACHRSQGFHEGVIETQRHCTGVAAYRANVGHVCMAHTPAGIIVTNAHDSTVLIGEDHEHYFSSPEEFVEHHRKGQTEE
jgi:hypothetical protein